ncbi:MAG: DUF2490 domain-containing protein [Bacteroidia bacterium]|nr:DUF2490 domain-containing protein [Bacteroidia bacterium]NNJ54942.1 DUF2490 domain-containing protein [Bacteroidia bacterium]
MSRFLHTLILVMLMTPFAFSQESDLGNWVIYLGNKKLNDKVNLHHEIQYRNYNALGDLEQLLLRTGIGYNLSPNNNNVLLGYGFIRSENYGDSSVKDLVNEHRIYQQFITKQSFGRFSLQHRYRIEERFVEENFKVRFRYFLSTNVALTNKKLVPKTVYLSAYNEVFINSQNQLFDRNRIYGGLGYKVTDNLKFEVGYMNQRFFKGSRDQVNLIANFKF